MRGLRRLALVGVCVALAASCGDNLKPAQVDAASVTPPQRDAAPPPVPTASILFSASLELAQSGTFQESFPLFTQRDILAVVAVPDAAGTRILRLETLGPDGRPYSTEWHAFATGTPDVAEVPHPVTQAPLAVETATVSGGLAKLIIDLPVAGTDITRHRLKGTFVVGVFLAGDQAACVGSFEIRGQP
jgi:hypothetical protein